MTDEQLRRRLDEVDWDFPRAGTPEYSVNAIHGFPGNFIPQIPSYLIQLLSTRGEVVLDPFAGSGTTGVEAVLLGRNALLFDAIAAATHVSRGKLSLLGCDAARVGPLLTRLRLGRLALAPLEADTTAELHRWFHPETLRGLQAIWREVVAFDGRERAALEVIFSNVLFRCAAPVPSRSASGRRRRHHWAWVADNVAPKQTADHDPFVLMVEHTLRALDAAQAVESRSLGAWSCETLDARSLTVASPVDLVVTSPPYLGMIDYVLANRLTYLWMGWPLEADLRSEMGARRFRNRRTAEMQYLDDLRLALERIHLALRPGGYFCLVLGSSRRFPTISHQALSLAREWFEVLWGPRPRNPSRRRVADRSGQPPQEWICVLRRQ